MRALIASLLRYRPLVIVALVAWIAGGILHVPPAGYRSVSRSFAAARRSDHAESVVVRRRDGAAGNRSDRDGALRNSATCNTCAPPRSLGLSDVKLYFGYDSDYYWDRQEVLNRLQLVSLPSNLSPQLSPESPIGEIYRYRLYGPVTP